MSVTKKAIWIFAAAISLSACSRSQQNTAFVPTAEITRGQIINPMVFVGNVTPAQTETCTWTTSGVVEDNLVELGDSVSEGQILASLSVDFLSTSVIRAEIPLISAQEELNELETSDISKLKVEKELADAQYALFEDQEYLDSLAYARATSSDIKLFQKDVEIQKGYLEDAEQLFDSVKYRDEWDEERQKVYENLLSVQSDYAEAVNAYIFYSEKPSQNTVEQAQAKVTVSEIGLENAQEEADKFDTFTYQYSLLQAQKEIEEAQASYNKRNIVSHINGTVTLDNTQTGQYVESGDVAFQIDYMDSLYIPLDVSEIDISKLEDGMTAEVKLDALSDTVFSGTVYRIDKVGVESGNSTSFPAYVLINDPDDRIKTGMTAEVSVTLEVKEDVLLAPLSAVSYNGNNSYLTVVRDDTTEEVQITTGLVDDTYVEITSGDIQEGDLIQVPFSAWTPADMNEEDDTNVGIEDSAPEISFSVTITE